MAYNPFKKQMKKVTQNTTKDMPDATKESFDRLKPVVQAILELVAAAKLPVGNNTNKEDDMYFPVAEKVLELMRDKDVKYMEKDPLFQLLLQPLDKIRTIVLGSLNKSANKAIDKKMGKEFDEVTLKDLDAILRDPKVPVV